ncbi:antibiotic biosynthesis monooxygenase family protein [Mycobacterium sp. C31M]
MTTITAGTGYATLINVFTVAPEKAEELSATLSAATEQVMRHQPGFVSANIHISTDHTRVVNYAQWESAEAYAAIFQDPTVTEHMGAAAAMAESFDPKLYTVETVHSTT